jgi:hypothetical protein
MMTVRKIAAAAAACGIALASPALAQVDLDMSYTANAGSIARTNIGNKAVDRAVRRRPASPSQRTREAAAVCAQRTRLLARHGSDDPRIRKLEQLCASRGL